MMRNALKGYLIVTLIAAGNLLTVACGPSPHKNVTANFSDKNNRASATVGSGTRPTSPRIIVSKTAVSGVPFSRLQVPPLDTVDFVSATEGFVGGRGVILKTTDGGQTWFKVYSGPEGIIQVDAVGPKKDVWGATDQGYLLHATDGEHFQDLVPVPTVRNVSSLHELTFIAGDFQNLVPVSQWPNGPPEGIQQIKFFADHSGYVLVGGRVERLSADGKWGGTTPPVPIDSISFPTRETGFAAGGNLLYKTTDGGNSWHKVFTAPVNTGSLEGGPWPAPWRAAIAAGTPTSAWFLVYGGVGGMSQVAYVLFHTTDGKHFTPVADEGYWDSAYPKIKIPNRRDILNIGIQPGPFTVLGAKHTWFIGLNGDAPKFGPYDMLFTGTKDNGISSHVSGLGRNSDAAVPDFFSPLAVDFVDPRHGWVVGSNRQHRGAMLHTTDGKTFRDAP